MENLSLDLSIGNLGEVGRVSLEWRLKQLEKRVSALEKAGEERRKKETFNLQIFSQHLYEGFRHALKLPDQRGPSP